MFIKIIQFREINQQTRQLESQSFVKKKFPVVRIVTWGLTSLATAGDAHWANDFFPESNGGEAAATAKGSIRECKAKRASERAGEQATDN